MASKGCTANTVCHADIEKGWCFPKAFSTGSVEYFRGYFKVELGRFLSG
jgi:hypothetical protein